jgi:group I intron endonuclease
MSASKLSRPSSLPGYGTIYLITNAINGKQYIGQTVQRLSSRWKQHLRSSRSGSASINRAMRKHGTENFTLRELSRVSVVNGMDLINKLEADAIQLWNTLAPAGYNLEVGGKNAGPCHPETRRKLSDALMGHVVSKETRAKLAITSSGKQYCLGRPVSPEVRAKISRNLKGRFRDKVFSPETRARISAGLKGRAVSTETRARISAGKKGRPSNRKGSSQTAESRARMSRSHTGVPMSVGRRANMCAAQKLRRANERAKAISLNSEQK